MYENLLLMIFRKYSIYGYTIFSSINNRINIKNINLERTKTNKFLMLLLIYHKQIVILDLIECLKNCKKKLL